MKRTLPFILVLCLALSAPALAGRITSTVLAHPVQQVYQANPTSDLTSIPCYMGYLGAGTAPVVAVPGVLCITPGCNEWPNYVAAARAGVPYTIKNVSFVKTTPQYTQCAGVFPAHTVTQQGTANIRKWWPLMYEIPSTTYTLTILYGTPDLFDDDGPTGPNPPAWVHMEQWTWHVDVDLYHLSLLLALFREVPFGRDEVPLISDEFLYEALQAKIVAAYNAAQAGDIPTAAFALSDFELEVMDACIGTSPAFPNPFGFGTGIANTPENPACCKLLVDAEYLFLSQFGMTAK